MRELITSSVVTSPRLTAWLDSTVPVTVCTIGNGDFSDAHMQAVTTTALAVFNDAIIRTAWSAKTPIIDLRAACDEPEDYVNETVPSARGSDKIAHVVVNAVTGRSG